MSKKIHFTSVANRTYPICKVLPGYTGFLVTTKKEDVTCKACIGRGLDKAREVGEWMDIYDIAKASAQLKDGP